MIIPHFSAIRPLYMALGRLPTGGAGRLSEHEDLLDILEVVAVALGLKPAHLQGQGCHDPRRVDRLETVSRRFGLRALRSGGAPSAGFEGLPAQIAAHFVAAERAQQQEDRQDRLWVYRDATLEGGIHSLLAGRHDLFAAVLGYPACCVAANAGRQEAVTHYAVAALGRAMGDDSPDALLAALKGEAGNAELLPDDAAALHRLATDLPSIARFPFIGFFPCAACAARDDSPAGRINESMKALAKRLSPALALAIVDAATHEEDMMKP